MNELYLIVPSNLKNKEDVIRFANSVDISPMITVLFVNQSENQELKSVYEFKTCRVKEYMTHGVVPLSIARNIVLRDIYKDSAYKKDNAHIMFVDDDAWFPENTINMLLECEVSAKCLRTIDPDCGKAFNGLSHTSGEVVGWHLIHDICSICLVVPYVFLCDNRFLFNEKLGLGNTISQGEESLFVYRLHKAGLRIFYNENYIYHPFKISTNINNKYSMSYFWAWGLTHVSSIFAWPCLKYLVKYTVALGLTVKSKRYPKIFCAVWKGAFDGMRDIEGIGKENET